ncbi:MAG: hypothetical protein ACYC0X_29670 [Pirellulaceae bacterium]
MPDDWKQHPAIRPEAVPFEAYNEGDTVFLYDESNRKELLKLAIGKHGADVLQESPGFRAELSKQGLLAVFDVERDCDACGYVLIGPPATAEELALGGWTRRQTAPLALPSGQMRLETLMSLSLGPEDCGEDATLIDVPPGDYVLEFSETGRNASSGTIPRILLILTPREALASTAPIKTRVVSSIPSKYTAYRIERGVFCGQIRGDGSLLNLDAAAARKLGWRFLSKLEITAGKQRLEAEYLGDLGAENYALLTDPQLVGNATWIGTTWKTCEEFRYKRKGLGLLTARGAPPAGLENRSRKWRAVTARVICEPLPPPEKFADSQLVDGALHGEVLVCSRKVLVLNISGTAMKDLGAIPARPAELARRRQRLSHLEQRLRLALSDRDRKKLRAELEEERKHEQALPPIPPATALTLALDGIERTLLWTAEDDDFFTAREPTDAPREPSPVLGVLRSHWEFPSKNVLWIQSQACHLDDASPVDLGFTVPAGSSARICLE